MDAGRFDAFSRSLANRRSRRSALRGLGAGGLAAGLLTALGVERASAASGTCALTIFAQTSAGPHKNKTYSGTLNLQIGDNGAIDQGNFTTDDGQSHPLVGQATGRALNLRITIAQNTVLELNGTADIDLIVCRGAASGAFGGPSDTDIGAWRTGTGGTSGSSANSSGGSSTSGGSTSGGSNSGGGGSTGGGTSSGGGGNTSGGGGTTCASGVVCNGVCCAPAAGLTPDSMVCNAGACECTYSCAAAGCPGNASGSIVNTCGSDPQPHCHSECNAPADNGCGDTTCADGQTLDVDSCTCVDANGAAVDDCGGAKFSTDPNNCGACGVVCGPTMNCFEASCVDVCAPNGLIACGATCINPIVDPNNCGACGFSCAGRSALGLCSNGQCI
jgi:hypothetical protein